MPAEVLDVYKEYSLNMATLKSPRSYPIYLRNPMVVVICDYVIVRQRKYQGNSIALCEVDIFVSLF